MIQSTVNRFKRFNDLRTSKSKDQLFWDVVVLTAADDLQKAAFEKQLDIKLADHRIPLSAEYLVVADPPGYKIGNGGSTLIVLKTLYEKYGDSFAKKRIIIIHAGGFSQRLPSASVLGKAFMAVPCNSEFYEMLEVKLASYIDLPSKIVSGGVFVCCADSFEAYADDHKAWSFSITGFTGLAHPSSLKVGKTHGVYVIEEDEFSLKHSCRQFLHKPSVSIMNNTKGCVQHMKNTHGVNEFVLSDSAFFISPPASMKLLDFYNQHSPLKCELDAYGDFLQSLGTHANSDYVKNVANVVNAESGLIKLRKSIFDHLHGANLDVVVLAPVSVHLANVTSQFYHFGTSHEYLDLFTNDKLLMEMLSVNLVSHCAGTPFKYVADKGLLSNTSDQAVPDTVLGLMGDIQAHQHVAVLPCVMYSVVHPGVSVGERSIVEYCTLREGVAIGRNSIVSHCSLTKNSSIPAGTFMHTVPVYADKLGYSYTVGYCTIVFGIDDNLKAMSPIDFASQLYYMGKKLCEMFSNCEFLFRGVDRESVSLWETKLFEVHETAEESSAATCLFLKQLSESGSVELENRRRLSMRDLLQAKNVDEVLRYRAMLQMCINKVQSDQSFLPRLEQFASKRASH